jgi:hypothetical protein
VIMIWMAADEFRILAWFCFCGCTILQLLYSQISMEGNSRKILNKHGCVHMNRGVYLLQWMFTVLQ